MSDIRCVQHSFFSRISIPLCHLPARKSHSWRQCATWLASTQTPAKTAKQFCRVHYQSVASQTQAWFAVLLCLYFLSAAILFCQSGKCIYALSVEKCCLSELSNLSQQIMLYDFDLTTDVVAAAKVCLPKKVNGKEGLVNSEILPCLNYILTPEHLVKLDKPQSVFGSPEICRWEFQPKWLLPESSKINTQITMGSNSTLNLIQQGPS